LVRPDQNLDLGTPGGGEEVSGVDHRGGHVGVIDLGDIPADAGPASYNFEQVMQEVREMKIGQD
jgi:hypothetical protein